MTDEISRLTNQELWDRFVVPGGSEAEILRWETRVELQAELAKRLRRIAFLPALPAPAEEPKG